MTRTKLYLLVLFLILITVPWFFSGNAFNIVIGFPFWVLYTLLSTLIYAVIISYLLEKYWSLSAREEQEE